MDKVDKGLYVSVDYKGTLQNGEVFDSSHGSQPLEVQMGVGQLIEGFEKELMGMSLKEKKTFTLNPEDAYGQIDEIESKQSDNSCIEKVKEQLNQTRNSYIEALSDAKR